MKKIISLFLLIFSIFTFYSPSQTFACSCMGPESPEKELERADYVFIGTVEKISEVTIIDEAIDEIFSSQDSFRLQNKVYLKNLVNIKGVNTDSISVHTPTSSASCGVNFSINDEYIVYGYENDKQEINVWLCGRTNLTENAQEDLAAFDDIIQKSKNLPLEKTNIPKKYYIIIATLIFVLFVLLIGIYKLSKQKHTD